MKKMGVLLAVLGSILLLTGLVLTSMIEQSHYNDTDAALLRSLANSLGAMKQLSPGQQLTLWGMDNVLLVFAAGAASIFASVVMIHKVNDEERRMEEANGHQNTWRCHKCNRFNKLSRVSCACCGTVDVLK